MADAILWATLTIASASLIFAFIAFRQVMATSDNVDGFIKRADSFLNTFKNKAKGMFTPEFIGDTISYTMTKGLSNEDGSPVTMHQYVQTTARGYIERYGPGMKAELKSEMPRIISYITNPQNVPPQGPEGPQNPGRALAQQRWGSGGLKAAANVGKAAKKLPFGQKIGEYVEGAQAVVQLGGALKELKEEVAGTFGKKGDNGDENTSRSTSPETSDWGPPF